MRIAVLMREKSNRSRLTPLPSLICADISLLDQKARKNLQRGTPVPARLEKLLHAKRGKLCESTSKLKSGSPTASHRIFADTNAKHGWRHLIQPRASRIFERKLNFITVAVL